MVNKVKDPTTALHPQENSVPATATKGVVPEKKSAGEVMPDAYQKAAQGILGYKSSSLIPGAYKIFTDGIVFPPNLLTTADPANDAKYLRLLAALWGMDDLEKYFHTLNEEQEKQRNVERDDRQRKKKEQEDSSEETEDEKPE